LHVSHIPGRGLKNLALGWHGKNDKFIVNTKAGQGLLRKEFIMGKFRVAGQYKTTGVKRIFYEPYPEYQQALKTCDELAKKRPKSEFWVEGKIDGEWYALA